MSNFKNNHRDKVARPETKKPIVCGRPFPNYNLDPTAIFWTIWIGRT